MGEPLRRRSTDRELEICQRVLAGELSTDAAVRNLFEAARDRRDGLHAWMAVGAPLRREADRTPKEEP